MPIYKIIIIGLVSLFLTLNYVKAVSSVCDDSLKASIEEVNKKFTQDLSKDVLASGLKSKNKDETIKKIRQYHCELEKICQGVSMAFYQRFNNKITQSTTFKQDSECSQTDKTDANTICLLKFSFPNCHFTDSKAYEYKKEDFVGDKAFCSLTTRLSDENTIESCYELIAINKKNVMLLSSNAYKEGSKQDEANYYSAKILSLTQKIKTMGDLFQRLKMKMTKVFEQICSCT